MQKTVMIRTEADKVPWVITHLLAVNVVNISKFISTDNAGTGELPIWRTTNGVLLRAFRTESFLSWTMTIPANTPCPVNTFVLHQKSCLFSTAFAGLVTGCSGFAKASPAQSSIAGFLESLNCWHSSIICRNKNISKL